MPRLFKIDFITKGSRLESALMALEGIALGKPEITPITGARVSGGQVVSTNGAYGNITNSVIAAVQKWPRPVIQRAELRQLSNKFGGSVNNVTGLIDRLKHKGLLKGRGAGNGYTIVRGKTNG